MAYLLRSVSVFNPVLSGKPKIYQGVRVKITVKELLQQRRAKQAVVEEAVSGESCGSTIQFVEPFSPPCAAPYVDAELKSSSSSCQQPWPFQSCITCEEIPSYLEQLVDSCLQTEPALDASLAIAQGNLPCSPDSYQPGPPPCLNQSLGTGSPDSSDPSSSFDYSYSPSQLPPFAPISYNNSPSPLEAKSCMYPSSEGSPYLQPSHVQYNHVPSACCCTSCGSQHLDTFRVSECFPYTNADCRDYVPAVSMADEFFRRDRSWDTCYS
ncbi:colorectal cancer-associated protein 2 [Sceloporus undulatus]|uniref:colorectal cancer-associated protein 2 n=1 Tax=Sceloporus undulatus TaxID=8520 RepID=UPI001C4C2245|nr:colorectal cancer-associated protein 2 [Sceloporus undulatus]